MDKFRDNRKGFFVNYTVAYVHVCVCVHGECTALSQQIRVLETQGRGGEL